MFDKLDDILIRYEEIMQELNNPSVAEDQVRFRRLMKEQTELSPVVDALAEEREDIKVVKVNTDEVPLLAQEFRVMSIPTLVVMKNGEETNRSIGVISKEEIEQLL